MSNEDNVKRCVFCHKLLIDEKIPICKRCILEGRNKVGEAAAVVGAVAFTVLAGGNNPEDKK